MAATFSLVILLLIGLFTHLVGAEYCFRKIHPTSEPKFPGGTVLCRGLIQRTFKHGRGCCTNGSGSGHYSEIVTHGQRGKKYTCYPCSTAPTLIPDHIITNGTGWSEWTAYTSCSKTCGTGVKTRSRLCEKPDRSCSGRSEQKQPCSVTVKCPVDGSWGPWGPFSECSVSCGVGFMTRERFCNNPSPAYGGIECGGVNIENKTCNFTGCPEDGAWSDWTDGGSCSATCGAGIMQRKRYCNNPAPVNGGKYCEGKDTLNSRCRDLPKCPLHGGWSIWTQWSACGITCGSGNRRRTRSCNAPSPRNGGRNCTGTDFQEERCYGILPCPVDGGWSSWSVWRPCLATPCFGAKGFQTRSRTCTNPQPKYRGSLCAGNYTQTQECYNNFRCAVEGNWCEWTSHDEVCLVSDYGLIQRRQRVCGCPAPEYGGRHCSGDDVEVKHCEAEDDGLVKIEGSGSEKCSHEGLDDEDC